MKREEMQQYDKKQVTMPASWLIRLAEMSLDVEKDPQRLPFLIGYISSVPTILKYQSHD